jgi:TetR/AcrR family transcriptional repressor of nem operon
MDLAQGHMQEAGYSSFSFRDLATAVGIKNPSVHHYFPTKPAMAAAVGRRYVERFFKAVTPQPDETADEVIAAYRTIFREGIKNGQMCLFGVLGAESNGLPDEVTTQVSTFFRRCVDDLEQRIGGTDARRRARHVMATLEGAQILVRAFADIEVFDDATECLTPSLKPPIRNSKARRG